MNKQHISEDLIKRYLDGTATEEEKALVESWHLQEFVKSNAAPDEEEITQVHAQMRQTIERHAAPPRKLTPWYRYAAAACILLCLSIGGYYIFHKQPAQQVAVLKPGTFKNDAMPGNKAYLTLSNGTKIAVTSLSAGQIKANTDAKVQKSADGEVVYQATQNNESVLVYNTFTVPRGGGKHEIKLADGTLAILDAESSIRFPVAFVGKERRVTITGQVYFEVVHNNQQPFYVNAGNQTIEDIGTHFNINAFEGRIKTTLIEGSVKVNGTPLKPGQQAIGLADGTLNVFNNIDEEEVLAWKNDLFKFNDNTSLQTVMNQLSRWYDMDIAYQGTGKTYHFGGDMPRYSKLSDVLKILAYNGVQFSVDGKKIIVYQ